MTTRQKMTSTDPLKAFFILYRREIKFVFLFITFFMIGQMLYQILHHIKPYLLNELQADTGVRIINFITPTEMACAINRTLQSGSFMLSLDWGCEGIEAILLIAAAICAFPINIKGKLLGFLTGSLLLCICNLGRIVAIYYTLKYRPGLFDLMHVLIGQTFIILIAVLFFVFWVSRCVQPHGKTK